jgi:uncharacterized protein
MRKGNLMFFLAIPLLLVMMMGGPKGGCSPQAAPALPADAELVRIDADSSVSPDSDITAPSLRILAEVARTQKARAAGLLGRTRLKPGHGMLYIFAEPAVQEFSEAGTDIALSTAFLTDDGTILALIDTGKRDPTLSSCDTPVRLVLQMRKGWFADRGIAAGARLLLPDNLFSPPSEPALEVDPEPAPDTTPQPETQPG